MVAAEKRADDGRTGSLASSWFLCAIVESKEPKRRHQRLLTYSTALIAARLRPVLPHRLVLS